MQETSKLFEGPDILILNHIVRPSYGFWNENSDLNGVPRYFAVNTISYINIATSLLPGLLKTNGSIVVVSAIVGVVTTSRTAHNAANKHALHGFFDSLRQDLLLQGHKGISVTLCVLGYIDTKNARDSLKGSPVSNSQLKAAPVGECSVTIIKGAALRKRQIYFPWYLSILETAQFFFPNFVESIVQVATNEKPLDDL